MNVVEWRGMRGMGFKEKTSGEIVPWERIVWDLTLECGHLVRISTSNRKRPIMSIRCETCEREGR